VSCDNRDNDCSGDIDEDFLGAPVACGQGVCAVSGAEVCVGGNVRVKIGPNIMNQCTPNSAASTSEVCDGLDNDCDGSTDANDATLVLANCENQQGVCAGSKKPKTLCVAGEWQSCTPTTYTAYTASYSMLDLTCDGVDNDCSGTKDDDYITPITTCGVGRCSGTTGVKACVNGVVQPDSCNATANAITEACNGLDDDCDGSKDDGFAVGASCAIGQSTCRSEGVFVCDATGLDVVCDAPVISGTTEVCDGVDNDCDGSKDEGFDVGATCTVGVGACARTGVKQCLADGTSACTATAGAPSSEVCDGLDNDCDGLTDTADADIVKEKCANQNGVCNGSNKTVCNGASGWAACTDASYASFAAPHYASTDSSCDNRDNDCSGQVDEDFLGANVSCGQGVCSVTGQEVCQAGFVRVKIGASVMNQCTPNAAASTSEVCDGLDNDCDGSTDASDNSLTLVACELQSGVCAGSKKSRSLCVAGEWQACGVSTYRSHAPQFNERDTLCDGLDNDCSGAADEDYVAPITTCGVGRCAGTTGRLECVNGAANVDTCDADAKAVSESCNGQDDDCDGSTDESYSVGETCSIGQFSCQSSGRYVCDGTGTGVVCDAPVISGTTERCDNLDNDCDGEKDEEFALGTSCTVGVGACARTGVRQCRIDGSAGCSVVAGIGSAELCDAIDKDCDGKTDEDVCQLDTTITEGPEATVALTTATFEYRDPVNHANTKFQCSYNGGPWVACDGGSFTVTGVTEGSHKLQAKKQKRCEFLMYA
jgi:hypothetical protein